MGKAFSALSGAMGSSSATKTSSRGKAGSFALLAGAAGLAFKNRDKLKGMARGNPQREDVASGTVYGGGTATGVQMDTGAPVSAVGTVEGHVPGSDTIDQPTSTQQQSD